MADELRMALTELLRKADAGDAEFLREGVRALAQALMELDLTQHLGAERYERALTRTGQRNGYRERQWDTRVGTIELQVPRVRAGRFFPSLLEPRKCAERALVAVVQEAYVQGVSTRRVDDLVQAWGMTGISKSQGAPRRSHIYPGGAIPLLPRSSQPAGIDPCGVGGNEHDEA